MDEKQLLDRTLVPGQNPLAKGFAKLYRAKKDSWVDHGVVFRGPSTAREPLQPWWEGTGSIWKAADGTYVANWSKKPNITGSDYQNISFAVSSDLLRWRAVNLVEDLRATVPE